MADGMMDRSERDRFLAALRDDEEFRAQVRRELLGEELLRLPQTVADLAATVAALVDAVAELHRELADQARTLRSVVDAMAETRRDLNDLIRAVHTYMQRLIPAIEALAHQVGALDERLQGLNERLQGLNERLEGLDGRVTAVESGLADLRQQVEAGFTAMKARNDQMAADIGDLRRRLAS